MQRLDQQKRRDIVTAAVRMFAQKPFHEVRLEDIAGAAHVGKGTVYTYFKNKDDLFLSLIHDGFAELVERVRRKVDAGEATGWELFTGIVDEVATFGASQPDFFQLMRSVRSPEGKKRLRQKRQELSALIEGVLRDADSRGEIDDPHPDLTAQFVISSVRGAVVHGPAGLKAAVLRTHLLRVLEHGLARGGRP